MRKFLKQSFIVLLSFISCFFMLGRQTTNKRKNILVVLSEYGIGDAICSLSALQCLSQIYRQEDGYQIFVAADRSVCNFLELTYNVLENMHFLSLELQDKASVSLYFKNRYQLSGYSWEQVISLQYMGVYTRLLIMGTVCQRVCAVSGSWDLQRRLPRLLNYFLPHLQLIDVAPQTMVFQVYEEVLQIVSGKMVRLSFPYIKQLPKSKKLLSGKDYCIISCGVSTEHANATRIWPLQRVAEVIVFIRNVLGVEVVLCGAVSEVEAANKMLEFLPGNCLSGLHNFVGKTSFADWIELTRGALFVFGNDSGYIHLAAAVQTQAFVIMSYHNYGHFFPYMIPSKNIPRGYNLPILIEAKRPLCSYCDCPWLFLHEVKAVQQKAACDEYVKRYGIYKCVDDIPVELAICSIKRWWENHSIRG